MKQNHQSAPVPVPQVTVDGLFWKQYMRLVRDKVIPYQWEALNNRIEGEDQNGCMHNFRVAAGMEQGEFIGMVFQDSDFAKWIEAVGFSLMWDRDPELEKLADEAIDVVCAAQQPDGYLNTYYIINGLDKRWTNLKDNHELYCLGHMIEGAIAYYEATGKDKLLNACQRYIDYVDTVFGTEPGKLPGYPGHEVIEMALVRLYDLTKNEKHLRLAKYFIDQRGRQPHYFEEELTRPADRRPDWSWQDTLYGFRYYQAAEPVRGQKEAEGHAVRAVYLYAGMADVANRTGDTELMAACETLWNNITGKQMYITGGIGSTQFGEAFTYNYDLPNDTIYAETCASIGLVFFARRMLENRVDSKYSDVMERALYNGILSGMSLDGQRFFYVNPLEAVPIASEKDHLREHVKVTRQKWFACACCPPNIARLLASIGSYAWGKGDDELYLHLYVGGSTTQTLGGKEVKATVTTEYPWKEDVEVSFEMEGSARFTFAVRVPGWANIWSLWLNGEKPEFIHLENGYAYIDREWSSGDKLVLHTEMPVEMVQANPRVREDIGKAAVMRGPLVYCIEEADNGPDLHRVRLGENPRFTAGFEPDLLGGVVTLRSEDKVLSQQDWPENTLYRKGVEDSYEPKPLKWIPYYTWTNRTPGEMLVWVRR